MATHGHAHGHELQRTWELTPSDVLRSGLAWLREVTQRLRIPFLICLALFVIGIIAIVAAPYGRGSRTDKPGRTSLPHFSS